ncbi:uncharacterized protein N7511_006525 [Penicillium nucicola]|uniref:uncharacterized protein n=1 Tax=Penicillium nucicola TaxID=1850975 RepID=UPI0025456716|nr:uncharacterized protein N7511_006525 [Penicillium nucicola]KAJ5757831.1 hypothetical protein N7511_006525 [Penicillium nucicola]
MSNPLAPLSSSYQNARAQSPADSSPFLHKTADAPAESAIPSSPLKREWSHYTEPSLNPYDENENYYPNEPEMANEHENDDYNDTEYFQNGASSPFQPDAREETVDFQKVREMRQAPRLARPQLAPLEEQSPASSPFRPTATDYTVDFQDLREAHPMSPGLDKRLALGDPESSPFRPDARDETVAFQRLHQTQQESPLSRPRMEPLGEESPESSPFRPNAREETMNYEKMREVEPMSPGIGRRLALEDPESSPFRPNARDETVDFDRLREMQNSSPTLEQPRLTQPIDHIESSPLRPVAREETPVFEDDEMEPEAPAVHLNSSPAVVPSSPLLIEEMELVESHSPHETRHNSPVVPKHSSSAVELESSLSTHEKGEKIGSSEVHETMEEPQSVHEDHLPAVEPSSPLHLKLAREFTESPKLQVPRDSPVVSKHSSPVAPRSQSRSASKENTLDVHKPRQLSRASLVSSSTATPRKRSYDQTPQDHEDNLQMNERCKKGMTSRAGVSEAPEIHIDAEEESSVMHNDSMLSTGSAIHDRSAIGNSMMEDKQNEGMSTVLHEDGDKENVGQDTNEHSMVDDSMDDTCLSAFSAVPDMTTFAKLRAGSPMKSTRGSVALSPAHGRDESRRNDPTTPSTARRAYRASAYLEENSPTGSPTPRRKDSQDMPKPVDSANLLDLTDQMNFHPHQSMQSSRFSPSRRSPLRSARHSIRSPGKMSSLLDFDIPPAPTPRSIPTVTPRELESLKSGFMSEISSLKATLSGKEAEVASLKTAVTDAERRVGEALEEIRNEVANKEALEMEQAGWGHQAKEMESVLRSVQTELMEGERERERLTKKAESAEKSKERLERKIVELESQLSAVRASSLSTSAKPNGSEQSSNSAEDTAREVQDAVEKVARELHTLYKGKHETKVTALKKSYESRWEKRLREVEKKLTVSREENEHLRVELDNAQSESMSAASTSQIAHENEEHEAEKRVMEAQIKGLQQEMAALRDDTERMRSDLQTERAEKGELVAAVDEWLAMQQAPAPSHPRSRETSVVSSVHHDSLEDQRQASREVTPDEFNRSVSRSVSGGIRPPATAEKRISRFGAPGGHSRGNSGGKSGIAMPTPGRGIMGSIERMGRGGA